MASRTSRSGPNASALPGARGSPTGKGEVQFEAGVADSRIKLNYPGSRIECVVTSDTESARARKIKEPWTADWVSGLPRGAVFYDVGANIGVMSLLACEDEAKGVRALAFEPAITNFPGLLRNIAINGLHGSITPLCIGLGAKTTLTEFNYQNTEAGGSLHSFESIIPFKKDRSTEPVMTVTALCYSLDDWIRIDDVPFPTHIKIDVDGTERSILRGAMGVLRDHRLREIQVEAVDFSPEETTSKEIVAIILACGFERFDLYPHNARYPIARDFRFYRSEGRSAL